MTKREREGVESRKFNPSPWQLTLSVMSGLPIPPSMGGNLRDTQAGSC